MTNGSEPAKSKLFDRPMAVILSITFTNSTVKLEIRRVEIRVELSESKRGSASLENTVGKLQYARLVNCEASVIYIYI